MSKEMEEEPDIMVRIAQPADVKYVYLILEEMERSARQRGTGISRRSPQSICKKIYDGNAVIALDETGQWVGFSCISPWSNGEFVSNGGLIVHPRYRHAGVATRIKQMIFTLSRERYPDARVFSITTGAAVMALNHHLGFRPVIYDEITPEAAFWDQCKACVNYPILQSQGRKKCLCTAMLFDPHFEKTLPKWKTISHAPASAQN